MKRRSFLIFMIPVIILSFMMACSSDDKDNTGPDPQESPELEIEEIEVPAALENSPDPNVAFAMGMIQLANSFTNMLFTPPPRADFHFDRDDGDEWTYSWSEGDLTITLTIWEEDGFYYWTVVVNGTDGEITYEDWTAMWAEQAIDGSSGHLIFYYENCTEIELEWYWWFDEFGIYHMVMEDHYYYEKIEITVNPDGSGVLDFYEWYDDDYYLSFRFQWTAAGTCEWWAYDEFGNLTEHGTWP